MSKRWTLFLFIILVFFRLSNADANSSVSVTCWSASSVGSALEIVEPLQERTTDGVCNYDTPPTDSVVVSVRVVTANGAELLDFMDALSATTDGSIGDLGDQAFLIADSLQAKTRDTLEFTDQSQLVTITVSSNREEIGKSDVIQLGRLVAQTIQQTPKQTPQTNQAEEIARGEIEQRN